VGVFGVYTGEMQLSYLCLSEIMLNAVNLLFVAFSTYHQDAQDKFCLFSMAVAAAEVAVGLAILVSIFRNLGSIDINNLKT
jgi:NADH-quinone oxidoreductase subunit K